MAIDLSKVGERERLKAQREPHWQRLRAGCYPGFRPSKRGGKGAWIARAYDEDAKKYEVKSLGDFGTQLDNDRQPTHRGGLIHHSDRGSQYVSIKYTERLAEPGIEPSVGSVGDSYDNALAETINGLYKAEVIHRRGPWRSFEAVEYATLEWVDWFNHRRLLEPIGNIPPAEAEDQYYAAADNIDMAA
jgi:transposase InsO family protein